MPRPRARRGARPPTAPDWYKDAVIYEVHVRAFRDSNGDGIGDFRGLTEKLDYLADLGVTALWLLPFFPSPGRDDGYDTADYTAVHADYGTLADVRTFIAEAHRRNLRVIGEVVLNHTSDQHVWFQRARRAPRGSPWREFYVERQPDAPPRPASSSVTSNLQLGLGPVAGAYYGTALLHQPTSLDNPAFARSPPVVAFWLTGGWPASARRVRTSTRRRPRREPAGDPCLPAQLRRHVTGATGDRCSCEPTMPEAAVEYFGPGTATSVTGLPLPLLPASSALRTEPLPHPRHRRQTPPIPETASGDLFCATTTS